MKADGIFQPIWLALKRATRVNRRKNVKRVKQNIASLTLTVKRKPGPVRAARQNLLPAHWQAVNHWMIS
jgi:hypothetical protein